jgi:hypothetical protein
MFSTFLFPICLNIDCKRKVNREDGTYTDAKASKSFLITLKASLSVNYHDPNKKKCIKDVAYQTNLYVCFLNQLINHSN